MKATYSPDDNKLRLYATERLDDATYTRVKSHGFKWAPKQKFFVAPMWTPQREDLLIELCGEIEDETMSLEERATLRAERFHARSEKHEAESTAAHDQAHRIGEHIPFGQPILVDHYSANRHRRDLKRIDSAMSKCVERWKSSQYWAGRAASAESAAAYKQLPSVRFRRIKDLESSLRRCERESEKSPSSAEWFGRWADHYKSRLEYERAALEASGGIVASQTKPEKGGALRGLWTDGGWAYIKRVNKVTVTIQHTYNKGGRIFDVKIPFDKINEMMTASDVQAAKATGTLKDWDNGIGFNITTASTENP